MTPSKFNGNERDLLIKSLTELDYIKDKLDSLEKKIGEKYVRKSDLVPLETAVETLQKNQSRYRGMIDRVIQAVLIAVTLTLLYKTFSAPTTARQNPAIQTQTQEKK